MADWAVEFTEASPYAQTPLGEEGIRSSPTSFDTPLPISSARPVTKRPTFKPLASSS